MVGQNKTPRTGGAGVLKCPRYNPIFVFDSQLDFGKRRLVPVDEREELTAMTAVDSATA
jgi:hypothetical protein